MLAILRRWFRRPAPARPAPAVRATAPAEPGAPVDPVVDRSAVARRTVDPSTVDPSAVDALVATVRARSAALRDGPAPPHVGAGYHAGVRALTAVVVDAPADAVRQLPSAAREALAVCDDPRAGVGDLVKVCEGDLAVARALLREANSVYYARPGRPPAASLREAVDRVGLAGVRNVLVDVTVSALLCTSGSRYGAITAAIWAHAQRTAALARAAAPAFGVSPERAYAAGLLHDVGKLVLLDRAATLVEQRADGSGAASVPWPALRAALLTLHEPLGGLTVLRWGMGADAAATIAAHHRAPPPAGARDAMGEVVCLSERVDHAATRGEPLDLEALWAEAALGGDLPRAAAALAAHLGPVTPFVAGVAV